MRKKNRLYSQHTPLILKVDILYLFDYIYHLSPPVVVNSMREGAS